jgi:hypothetical protein
VSKSGKATYGIEYFYNGSASRAEKGLEISVIAIVDVDTKQGYALSVQQTPPAQPESERARIDWYLEQLAATTLLTDQYVMSLAMDFTARSSGLMVSPLYLYTVEVWVVSMKRKVRLELCHRNVREIGCLALS